MNPKNEMLKEKFTELGIRENKVISVQEIQYTKDEMNLLKWNEIRNKYYAGENADTELGTKASQGAGKGAAIGSTMGALTGIMAAIGTSLVIPALEMVIAGPVAGGFAGAGLGGLIGGIIGIFLGSSIPGSRDKIMESGSEKGQLILGVNTRMGKDAKYYKNMERKNK